MSDKITWPHLKAAAIEAAGTAWNVDADTDPRYLTLTDPATLRTVQAYHVDGLTVLDGATVSMREAARRLTEIIPTAHRFGGLGDMSRLVELASEREDEEV